MVTIGGQKTIESVRIVMQAVGVTPLRAAKAERAIEGEKMTEGLIEKAARLAAEEAQPISDVYGSADYKREMVKVATKRAVKEAFKRATKLVA
jgi:carbon-monoxide dehydrogenase medium subunit